MTPVSDLVERLRERLKLKYMGDCKCGSCQLVPAADVREAADAIALLESQVKEARAEIGRKIRARRAEDPSDAR